MSFLNSIEHSLLLKTIKQVLAIEVIEVRNENDYLLSFNAVLLIKEKSKIKIRASIEYTTASILEEWIRNNVPPKTKIVLNINTDRAIHKLSNGNNTNDEYIKELIPNVDIDNFYTQTFPISDNQNFISIIRKNVVENMLHALHFIEHSLINVAVGPFFLMKTYKYLFQENSDGTHHVRAGNYYFLVQNNRVLDYKIEPYYINTEAQYFTIDDEQIPVCDLSVYSFGIYYLLHPSTKSVLPILSIQNNNDENNYQCISKPLLAGVGVITLLALMISSVLFSVYQKKNTELLDIYASKQAQWEKYKEVQNDQQRKREILELYGLYDSSSISFYADQLTFILPENVFLKKMQVHPVNNRHTDDNMTFIQNKIILEGYCYSSADLNDWIIKLKKYKWVRDIIIKDYTQNMEDLATFNIEITKNRL